MDELQLLKLIACFSVPLAIGFVICLVDEIVCSREPKHTCAECRHYFGFGAVFGDVPRCAACVDAITSLPRPCEEVRGCKRCNKSARKRDSDDKHD